MTSLAKVLRRACQLFQSEPGKARKPCFCAPKAYSRGRLLCVWSILGLVAPQLIVLVPSDLC